MSGQGLATNSCKLTSSHGNRCGEAKLCLGDNTRSMKALMSNFPVSVDIKRGDTVSKKISHSAAPRFRTRFLWSGLAPSTPAVVNA